MGGGARVLFFSLCFFLFAFGYRFGKNAPMTSTTLLMRPGGLTMSCVRGGGIAAGMTEGIFGRSRLGCERSGT